MSDIETKKTSKEKHEILNISLAKPKKKRVMTQEMLDHLADARQKCKEKRESQAGVITTAKTLKQKEKQLRELRLKEKMEKLAQVEAEIEKKSKRFSVSKVQEEEDRIEELENEIKKKTEISKEDEIVPVIAKKKKAKKAIVYESSDSSDSEEEVILTKRQLNKLMNKSKKPLKETVKQTPLYEQNIVDYTELFLHRDNF